MIRISTSTANETAFVEMISNMMNSGFCKEIIIVTDDDKKNPCRFNGEDNIRQILKEMAISPNLNGYKYIIKALEIIGDSGGKKLNLSKGIYPEIANTFKVNPSSVDRAVRHAIYVAFHRGNKKFIEEIFGNACMDSSSYPTAARFIYTLSERVNQHEN